MYLQNSPLESYPVGQRPFFHLVFFLLVHVLMQDSSKILSKQKLVW